MSYPKYSALTPTAAEVRSELARILADAAFSGSKRFQRFLSFLVEESLAGREDSLKAYTIAVEVFARKSDFDPQRDPIVRVEAARLRRRLDSYYVANQHAAAVHISLPKGGYRPEFSYMAPTVDLQQTTGPSFNKDPHRKPIILVLPFTALNCGTGGLAYLPQSLEEETVIALGRFEDLTVIHAPKSHTGKEYTEPAWDLADSLGARFILYGSIQEATRDDGKEEAGPEQSETDAESGRLKKREKHGSVRVRVCLVDSRTRSSLWAERFDCAISPGAPLQSLDDLAVQVAMTVGDCFGLINRFLVREQAGKSVESLSIHEAILRYNYWVNTISFSRGREARLALERAVALDPSYGLPHALLADLLAAHYQWGCEEEADWLAKAAALAATALDLDAGSQYAQWAWAFCLFLNGDGKQFAQLARRAIACNPYNSNIRFGGGVKLCMLNLWDEGLAHIDEAAQLNRSCPSWTRTAWVLRHYLGGNYHEAIAQAKLITTPDFWGGPLMRAAIYGRAGLQEEAASELAVLKQVCPRFKRDHQELMRRLFFQQAYVDELMRGLAAAGFNPD